MTIETGKSMTIRQAVDEDKDKLLLIWRRSVEATHDFLSREEVEELTPLVQSYLRNDATDFWVGCDDAGQLAGFMGIANGKIESLFLDPDHMRQGIGRRLVQHAEELCGSLLVDVNEQNPAAIKFYEACGFRPIGRSEFDEQGKPRPLNHLALGSSHEKE